MTHGKAATIEFDGVTKRYGDVVAVRNLSISLAAGTLTTLLGPSGCGKTTTLRLIAGLELPTSGQIRIGGRDVSNIPASERDVSMVFQSYALFPHMTVMENVRYGLDVAGVARQDAVARAQDSLASVGLRGLDARLPAELSGGQQQRVALARALVLEPSVLLFDEPLSNLDARLRREMREEIRAIQLRLSLTVAYVTHDQSEALAVSDQIIVMDHGIIAQHGAPQELYGRPQSEFVAAFMGEAMVFPAVAQPGGRVSMGPLTLRPRYDVAPGVVKVAVRPEAWEIGAAIGLSAVLRKAAYLGSFYEYDFETPLGPVFVVSADLSRPLAVGAQTTLSLRDQGVSVVPGGV